MKNRAQPSANNASLLSTKTAKFSAKQFERPGLSEDEITEIKEAFDLFDPEGTGFVNPRGTFTFI